MCWYIRNVGFIENDIKRNIFHDSPNVISNNCFCEISINETGSIKYDIGNLYLHIAELISKQEDYNKKTSIKQDQQFNKKKP